MDLFSPYAFPRPCPDCLNRTLFAITAEETANPISWACSACYASIDPLDERLWLVPEQPEPEDAPEPNLFARMKKAVGL